ncbi:MAG: thioredoxin family protein [Chitinophagales bacterium]
MRKLVFSGLLNLLFALHCIAQQGIKFREISFKESLGFAATENKPVLLMSYEKTCGHCEKMLTEVFIDSTLGDFFNANFVSIKKELSEPEGGTLAKKFFITSFPTFVILNKEGDVLYQFVGEFKGEDFLKQGQQALIKENQMPYLQDQFENNMYDSTACYKYLQALSKGRIPTQEVVERYFEANKNNFEISTGNWKILSTGVSDISSAPFSFILKNKEDFAKVVTQKKVDRKIYLTCAYNLQTAANANDTILYFSRREVAMQFYNDRVDSLIFVNDLSIYEKHKQYTKYLDRAFYGTAAYTWNDATQLRRIGEMFLLKTSDTNYLAKALTFAVRSVDLKPDYFNTILAAKLALKLEDKIQAKNFAEQAKMYAEQRKTSTTEAESILEQCK